ncbi:hepatic leukemia factor, partial [Huso huso]
SGGRQTHSAFLGPLLWEKTLPCEGGLFQLQYMDLEEFLTENGMGPQTSSMAAQIPSQNSQSAIPNQSGQSQSGQQNQSSQLSSQHPGQLSQLSQLARAPSPTSPVTPGNGQPSVAVETGDSSSCPLSGQATPPDPSSCPQSDPSEVLVKFDPDPADLALSSVPGQEAFDPRRHSFTEEELKPQPMIKKAKKMLVPDEQKVRDDKYWSRRYKNNEAAKRSRDARRLKENQISVRAAFLEKENAALRQEVADMRKELGRCRNTLHKYEARHGGP